MSWINDYNDSLNSLTNLETKIIKVISNMLPYHIIDINNSSLYYNIIGDIINIGVNSTEFDNNLKLIIKRNDIRLLNGLDVFYIDSSSINLPINLLAGETIIIEKFLRGT